MRIQGVRGNTQLRKISREEINSVEQVRWEENNKQISKTRGLGPVTPVTKTKTGITVSTRAGDFVSI